MKPSVRNVRKTVLALASLAVAAAGCSSAYDSAYYDPYTYYSYYPADVAYSSYYWADPYYYSYQDYGGGSGTGTGTGSDGSGSTPGAGMAEAPPITPTPDAGTVAVGSGIGDVIRSLARGDSVCGDKVSVAAKTQGDPCSTNSSQTIRAGVTLVFSGCELSNGGTLSGTIDVETSRTASEPTCTETTTITISHTTTITNLVYTGPGGRRLVIPTQTGTGTTSYQFGQRPASASAHLTGRLQIIEASGLMASDRTYDGDVTVTPAADRATYSIDGTLTLTDLDQSGMTVLTATNLTRTAGCCRPVAGRLGIVRTGTMAFAQHIWTFDSATCGGARFDDEVVTLSTCI